MQERGVEVRSRRERGAERVKDAGAHVGAFDDRGEELRLELRLGEGADHMVVADAVADLRDAGGAGGDGVVERDAAGGGDGEAVLEVLVGVVEDDEGLAANRGEFGRRAIA